MSSLDNILKTLSLGEEDNSYVLIVGGLGYIGSHTTLELLKAGYNVLVVDNLSNSFEGVLQRIRRLATDYCHANGRKLPLLKFYQADYRSDEMRRVIERYSSPAVDDSQATAQPTTAHTCSSRISGVIHFAAYKSVEDSIRTPLAYYQNNVCGLVDFLLLLEEFNIRTFIFSSSATVYGAKSNAGKPLHEEDLVHHETPTNSNGEASVRIPGAMGLSSPYGRSKYFSEAILADLALASPAWRIIALRYFNPVGCHESGMLGEDPRQKPTNLFPVITQVLLGARPVLEVFGTDWDTHDGTAIRDFIHVVDLARGHVAALAASLSGTVQDPFRSFNLGTGRGASVAEVVRDFEQACSRKFPVHMTGRRAGDIGYSVAGTERVQKELEWGCERSLEDAARDCWNFASKFRDADSVAYRDPYTRRPSL